MPLSGVPRRSDFVRTRARAVTDLAGLDTYPAAEMQQRWPPYTILAFVAIVATTIVVLVPGDPDPRAVGGATVLVLLTAGLWYGIWPVWLLLFLITGGNTIRLLMRPDWAGVLLNGTLLILLVAPPTQRHVHRGRPPALSR